MSELFESRKLFLNNLVSLLLSDNRSIDESLSVSIHAGWGYGKSFFLNQLAEKLESDGHMVVRFNAWETDLSNDAFISFSDSLFNQLGIFLKDSSVFFEKANLAMIAFGSVLFDKFSSGLPIVGTLKQMIIGTREMYKELVENGGSFFVQGVGKSGLELVKEKVSESLDEFFCKLDEKYSDKSLVILVDELDRCRPDYAVQVLERVKHLFKDSRLSLVFAINKSELEKSVRQAYGDIDTSVYFEKFFTFSFRLPQIDVSSFLESDIAFDGNECQKVYYDLLCQMVKDSEKLISLRQVERIFEYFEAVCMIVSDFDAFTEAPYLIPVAVFSKVVDGGFFHGFFEKGKISDYFNSVGNNNSKYQSVVYEKFRVYDSKYNEYSPVFKQMCLIDSSSEESRPGHYMGGNRRVKLCTSMNNGITIIASDHEDLRKIYSLVDCLS